MYQQSKAGSNGRSAGLSSIRILEHGMVLIYRGKYRSSKSLLWHGGSEVQRQTPGMTDSATNNTNNNKVMKYTSRNLPLKMVPTSAPSHGLNVTFKV